MDSARGTTAGGGSHRLLAGLWHCVGICQRTGVHHRRRAEHLSTFVIQYEVVSHRHLIALLLMQRFKQFLSLKPYLHHHLRQNVLVERAELRHDLVGSDGEVKRQRFCEPSMPADLGDGDSLKRVDDLQSGIS